MPKFPATFMAKRGVTRAADFIITVLSFIVFFILDFLDALLCVLYRFIDDFLEGSSAASSCYCSRGGEESEVSETLRRRKNVFRGMLGGFTHFAGIFKNNARGGGRGRGNRWSDCGCESCVSWMKNGVTDDLRLHFVVTQPSKDKLEDVDGKGAENVIFLHGFMASSSFWTQTVFPYLSEEDSRQKYRLFAVDLLGFGKSPKPMDCLYTIRDHIEMIEKTVIVPFEMKSFHLVAHSMGCVIAVALAARYSKSLKSITLIAPPYFPSSGEDASVTALEKLAARRVWPPLLFGSAFMSWYEHLGRCVCFLFCRNHRTWERILKLITRRDVHFVVVDMTRHTHHSAWHSMHNVICGGAKVMDKYLETLRNRGVKMNVIQGSKDQVVPLECSSNMKMKVGDNAEVKVTANVDHTSVVVGREEEFTRDLEQFWASITTHVG
nr:probable lysophospholipase BODYGUARD 4 [Ipomoea batatas]